MKSAFILLFVSISLFANIRFYPSVIYAKTSDQFATIHIENSSKATGVYKFEFGYTGQDDKGGFVAIEESKLDPKIHRSFCKNLKVFPKRIKLEPGETQTIRLTIKPSSSTTHPLGEYYCRIYARGMPELSALDTTNDAVKAQIQTAISIGGPIHFITGLSKMDLDIETQGFKVKDDKLFYKIKLVNKGTVGLRGQLSLTVKNEEGIEVSKGGVGFVLQQKELVLFPSTKIDALAPGKYTAKLTISDSSSVDPDFKQFSEPQKIVDFEFTK